MYFVIEFVLGEIILMFISYLVFCIVLMYFFVKIDKEWGSLEVLLDDIGQCDQQVMVVVLCYVKVDVEDCLLFDNGLIWLLLQYCVQYYDVDCICFMWELKKLD